MPTMNLPAMRLARFARKWYRLEIDVAPAVTVPWEASFDGGFTWQEATDIGGFPAWLVAGPDAPLGPAVAVITKTLTPLVRVADQPGPEILGETSAPTIILED